MAELSHLLNNHAAVQECDDCLSSYHSEALSSIDATSDEGSGNYLIKEKRGSRGKPTQKAGIFIAHKETTKMENTRPTKKRKKTHHKNSSMPDYVTLEKHIIRVPYTVGETVKHLCEYRWPPNPKMSQWYFLEDHVQEYIGLKSIRRLKRMYPHYTNRPVDAEEKSFLHEAKVISSTESFWGLKAVPSDIILDVCSKERYDRYQAYLKVRDEHNNGPATARSILETSPDQAFMARIIQSTCTWNRKLNQDRKTTRAGNFDMQTFQFHYPVKYKASISPKCQKFGRNQSYFPVAVLLGQYVDNYS